jgi:hypothetical protein
MVALHSAVLDSITLHTPWTHRACSTRMCAQPQVGADDPQRSVQLLRQRLSCVPTTVNGEQLLLPAWDGSKTALADSKSGFGLRKSGDLAPYISETGSGRVPAGTTKSFPTVLVPTKSEHHSIRSHSF